MNPAMDAPRTEVPRWAPGPPLSLSQVCDLLHAEMLEGQDCVKETVEMVGASDLMSDVLAFMKPGSLLLTGLKNSQVVRTAEMADLKAVCLVRGRHPDPDTRALAKARGLPLLKTPLGMFEACGRLYMAGMRACF